MPRPKKAIPTTPVRLHLPTDLMAQVNLSLYSELEGRIPYNALAKVVEEQLRNWVKAQQRAADGITQGEAE